MFKTNLRVEFVRDGESGPIWRLVEPLVYESQNFMVIVPTGFETDLASVPRVPLAYWACGGEANKPAVVHDYLYCTDAYPNVTRETADKIFLEAMIDEKESVWRRQIMFRMVRLFACGSFHKRKSVDPR